MNSKEPSRRNHYVAKFYLRKWTGPDGTLWRYCRDPHSGSMVCKPVHPKATGFALGINTLKPELFGDQKSDALEDCLSKLDCDGAHVHDMLLKDGPNGLSKADRRLWARFLHVQLDRDPGRVRMALELSKKSREQILRRLPSGPALDKVVQLLTVASSENLAKGQLLRHGIGRDEWVQRFVTWNWQIIRFTEFFITSDKPVLLNFGLEHFGSEAWVVSIALSPSALLVCTPPSWQAELNDEWYLDMGVRFNPALVSFGPRFVYSARPLHELPGPKFHGMVERYLVDAGDLGGWE